MCISVVSHGLRISIKVFGHCTSSIVIFMYIIHSVCAVSLILVVSSVKRYYFVIQLVTFCVLLAREVHDTTIGDEDLVWLLTRQEEKRKLLLKSARPPRNRWSVRSCPGGVVRIRRETGPLLRRERHHVEKKRAILLTAVGPGTYRLLKTLACPRRLDELRFVELVDVKALQPETVSDRQALRVQLPFTEGGCVYFSVCSRVV